MTTEKKDIERALGKATKYLKTTPGFKALEDMGGTDMIVDVMTQVLQNETIQKELQAEGAQRVGAGKIDTDKMLGILQKNATLKEQVNKIAHSQSTRQQLKKVEKTLQQKIDKEQKQGGGKSDKTPEEMAALRQKLKAKRKEKRNGGGSTLLKSNQFSQQRVDLSEAKLQMVENQLRDKTEFEREQFLAHIATSINEDAAHIIRKRLSANNGTVSTQTRSEAS